MAVNYEKEVLLYLKLRENGQRIKQAEFCIKRSTESGQRVALSSFKRHLARVRNKTKNCDKYHAEKSTAPQKNVKGKSITKYINKNQFKVGNRYDWDGLKLVFLEGPWRSIGQFAKALGTDCNSSHFRKKTAGWADEKRRLNKEIDIEAVKKLVTDKSSECARDLFVEMRTYLWRLVDIIDHATEAAAGCDIGSSMYQCRNAAMFVKDVSEGLERTMTTLRGAERIEDFCRELDRLYNDEIDVFKAAIIITKMGMKLPKALEMMMSLGYGDDPPTDDGDIITEEQIIARRKEILQEIETQRVEFVPTRTREIRQLKQELTAGDSFGQQKAIKGE